MNIVKPLISVLGALAMSGAANAAILTGSTGSAANAVTNYSTGALVSFDLDLQNFSATKLDFMVEADDLLLPHLSLNAIVRNLSGQSLEQFNFTLDGISFAAAGSVTPTFGTLGSIGFSGTKAAIEFGSPEWAEFHFGNPLTVNGKTDWLLSTQGLRAGDAFSITAAVPEPGSMTLMLSALVMLAFAKWRREQR